MYEIATRLTPFELDNLTTVTQVNSGRFGTGKKRGAGRRPLPMCSPLPSRNYKVHDAVLAGQRPTISSDHPMSDAYIALMRQCWDQQPSNRPSFKQVLHALEIMSA